MATHCVRDVPDDLMARLRARAADAKAGLRAHPAHRELSVLTMEDAAERAERISSGSRVTSDDILDAIEQERAARE